MKKKISIIVLIVMISQATIFSQNQNIFRQMDWGVMLPTGGVLMRVSRPLGDINNENQTRSHFVMNILLHNIDQTGDVAFIFQANAGLGWQKSFSDNFYGGLDLCGGAGFSWIKELSLTLSLFGSTLYSWEARPSFSGYSSLYLGYNSTGPNKRFTMRLSLNPYACFAIAPNAVGKTNYIGVPLTVSLGFAINKPKK
jgi:hypothetical protein